MTAEKIKILGELKNKLKSNLEDNLKEVVLFGSQLGDSGKPESDYDILVIVRKKNDWRLERLISDICYEIDLKYNIITDTHVLDEEELVTHRGKQPIFYNAISKGYYA